MTRLSFIPLLVLIFLSFTLFGCAYTVHRDLTHRDFSIKYPNWEDYELEKYEDSTFKVLTVNKKETCKVQLASYATDYLTVSKILLETIDQTPVFTLLNKTVRYQKADIDYLSEQSEKAHVSLSIRQCGDFTYVLQYSCLDTVYEKYLRSIKTVKNSVTCVAPLVYDL